MKVLVRQFNTNKNKWEWVKAEVLEEMSRAEALVRTDTDQDFALHTNRGGRVLKVQLKSGLTVLVPKSKVRRPQ